MTSTRSHSARPVGGGPPPAVGNDVVDLTDPRMAGKALDERFVARVLAPTEAAFVAPGTDDDDLRLWSLWAAKEAAYKAATTVRGRPPVFEHAAFVVSLSPGREGVAWEGGVRWEELEVPVRILRSEGVLHAVALLRDDANLGAPAGGGVEGAGPTAREGPVLGLERLDAVGTPWGAPYEALLERFTERERDAIHAHPSAAVRLAARADLAGGLAVDESRLEIVCAPGPTGRRPPRLLLDGRPAPVVLSLSHHGGWIGWAWMRTAP